MGACLVTKNTQHSQSNQQPPGELPTISHNTTQVAKPVCGSKIQSSSVCDTPSNLSTYKNNPSQIPDAPKRQQLVERDRLDINEHNVVETLEVGMMSISGLNRRRHNIEQAPSNDQAQISSESISNESTGDRQDIGTQPEVINIPSGITQSIYNKQVFVQQGYSNDILDCISQTNKLSYDFVPRSHTQTNTKSKQDDNKKIQMSSDMFVPQSAPSYPSKVSGQQPKIK